jgi:hypothetical protein
VLFAVWENVQDSGIRPMDLSIGAALLGPISSPCSSSSNRRDRVELVASPRLL